VAHEIAQLAADEDGVSEIVIGMPVRLDGSPGDQTAHVTAFVAALRMRTTIPIRVADERLTSREAESRLAANERDWPKRGKNLGCGHRCGSLAGDLDHSGLLIQSPEKGREKTRIPFSGSPSFGWRSRVYRLASNEPFRGYEDRSIVDIPWREHGRSATP
jgi:hypothetical protein